MKTIGMTGKKHSEATKAKMRASALGRKQTPEAKRKISEDNKKRWIDGRMSVEKIAPFLQAGANATRGKPNLHATGSKSHLWKGGITALHDQIRTSLEYKLWARAVKERDNFTCASCGDRSRAGHSVYLHSDHIKPFATHPDLRFAIDNGQTLCKPCHALKTSEDMKLMRQSTQIWNKEIE